MRGLTLAILFLICLPEDLQAGVDAPGGLSFEFGAETSEACADLSGVEDSFTEASWSEAYFSSDASQFGEQGVLIWAGFALEGPDGLRHATLLLDLDPGQAQAPDNPLPTSAWTLRYSEHRGDQLLFEADFITGEVGIFSYRSGEDDEGGIDGWFNLLITDSRVQGPGCRMLLKGRFGAQTSESFGSVGGEGTWTEADSTDRGCDSSGTDAVWFGCEAVAEDDGYEDSGCGGYEDDGSGWATEDTTTD
ncbi:MAG: hypothetical protein KAI66_10780, partial [Lentisphaeria bacterium]|nr:hypothetical protein [Lentisphaeria bacterium]